MKRIFLTAAGLFALLHTFAQQATDTTGFKSRQLKVEEVNLVSSYYAQDGNNAAVTGGIGSQKLTDIVNVIDVKLTRYDKKLRKHSYTIEAGIDHYTSASSDQVDLKANSSAPVCLVLILVDSFSRYAQWDKMPVFYVLLLVIHLCFIS